MLPNRLLIAACIAALQTAHAQEKAAPVTKSATVKPDDIMQANYDKHCPCWALGFQELALAAGAKCFVKFPGHPADEAEKDIWDFVVRRLRP